MVTSKTTLKSDWINLSNVSYQLKFYGISTIKLMAGQLKKKWLETTEFKKFKHVHPFVLQLFDFIARLLKLQKNPRQDKEIIAKYCWLIEFFAFNTINLLLIDRVRGANILMNCILTFT